MGVTMYLQQKLNPQPTDPVQARVFQFLPILFTFMLAPFSAGLVIYWTWNNLLSILQQGYIMRTPRGRVVTRHAYLHFGLNIPSRMGEMPVADEFLDAVDD